MNALLADLAREREQRSGPFSPAGASPATTSAIKRPHNTIDLCDSDDEEPTRSHCSQETADRALAERLAWEQEERASSDFAAKLAQQFSSGGGGMPGMLTMGGGCEGMDPERLRLSFARGSGRVHGALAERARVGTCGFSQIAFYPREVKDKGKHEHYAERFGAVRTRHRCASPCALMLLSVAMAYPIPGGARRALLPGPSQGELRVVAAPRRFQGIQGGARRRVRARPQVQRLLHAQEAAHRRRRLPRAVGGLHGQVRRARGQVPGATDAGAPPPPPPPPSLPPHAPRLSRLPRRIHGQFNGTDKAGLCFKRTEATHARLVAFAALITDGAAMHRASGFDPIFVLEFRHASWFCEEVYALVEAHPRLTLAQIHHARCPAKFGQLADGWHPSDAVASRLWKGKLCYVRPHGTMGFTRGDYGRAAMAILARRMQAFLVANPSAKAYAFFNNDASFGGVAGETPNTKSGQLSSCVCDGYALAEALSDK